MGNEALKYEVTGEEAVTDVILREIRELGEAIILLDQHPSLISKPGVGNTYTTLAMNLKHRGDIAMTADSTLLDSEQRRCLGRLELGWGMVKLQGRWFYPFLVQFPLVKLNKGSVTDEIIRGRVKAWRRRLGVGEGKTIDIVAKKNGKKIAIEIETGKSDALGNVQKSAEAGFDEVLSVASSSHV